MYKIVGFRIRIETEAFQVAYDILADKETEEEVSEFLGITEWSAYASSWFPH